MTQMPPEPSTEISDEALINFAIRFTHGGVSSAAFMYTTVDGKIYARFTSYGSKYTATLRRGHTLRLES